MHITVVQSQAVRLNMLHYRKPPETEFQGWHLPSARGLYIEASRPSLKVVLHWTIRTYQRTISSWMGKNFSQVKEREQLANSRTHQGLWYLRRYTSTSLLTVRLYLTVGGKVSPHPPTQANKQETKGFLRYRRKARFGGSPWSVMLGPVMHAGFVPWVMPDCFPCTPIECPGAHTHWVFSDLLILARLLDVCSGTSLVTSEMPHIFKHLTLPFGLLLCGLPCRLLAHVCWIFWYLPPSIYRISSHILKPPPLVGFRHSKYILLHVLVTFNFAYFFLHWTKILTALNFFDTGKWVCIFAYWLYYRFCLRNILLHPRAAKIFPY